MARTTKSLTDKEISNAKPQDKEYTLFDGNGLRLRVKPNGTKTWLFNYTRPHNGKRANMTFGSYPSPFPNKCTKEGSRLDRNATSWY
ncbi:TPA: integrase arm-type DNA-binding domain-containing protein [Vibrio cholerae]|nr:integrase arm-type DNA-binding domain-containing protein [Vibrio cholerae]